MQTILLPIIAADCVNSPSNSAAIASSNCLPSDKIADAISQQRFPTSPHGGSKKQFTVIGA